MIELAFLAVGFGLMAFAALPLYAIPDFLKRHEGLVWGALAGAIAFLALSHAGFDILLGNAFYREEVDSAAVSALVIVAGFAIGLGSAWIVVARTAEGGRPSLGWVAWGGIGFLAIHSLGDGLVLGSAYVGPFPSGYPATAWNVPATLIHRFAEGALVVVPAVAAGWRWPKALAGVAAALATIPGAYAYVALFGSGNLIVASSQAQGLTLFVAGLEAGFGLLLLFAGYLTWLATEKGLRWTLWAGLGFAVMLLVHLVVE